MSETSNAPSPGSVVPTPLTQAPGAGRTRRAVGFDRTGGPEVLIRRDLVQPEPGPGEVAVRVAYAGVNFVEVLQRRGAVPVPALPFVPGLEVSGHVAAVGPGIVDLPVGTAVAAFTIVGGYAELVNVPAARVFPLVGAAAGMSLEAAAAVVTIGTSAVAMLTELARVGPRSVVVVSAAAGGAGAAIAAVARHLGVSVLIGTVGSADKVQVARAHGYDIVVPHADLATAVHSATGGRGADVVLDSVGGQVFEAGLASLAPMGRLVKFGSAAGRTESLPSPMALALANVAVMGWSSIDLALAAPEIIAPATEKALALVADGSLVIPVQEVFDLSNAAKAHRLLEGRRTTGKLLLLAGQA
ncbi:zinc-binding dehydrogenase [Frankia sp. AgKG'84/4]|uniref:zinc-binding dehydrogenase n=1 Tax=Frankia sp. AgKG'84/4 TaxID=573490 RepID=UPI00200CB22F|nr:zinc-binding dehydrogenase [Frankia sp. AgKG'84/4]MCL9792885.1 zinc-binding dehydrogenase [Frankia sp. AgKG'84/4]